MEKSKGALLVIFLTVFLDLVGFGIIIPLSPYLATHFGASPLEVGLLMAIFSLMQFVFSPFWGRLSDRVGRRPVILISLLGTSLAHLVFAYSSELWMLFLSRGLAGVAGGNISAAMAYVADVTGEKDRSKGMGLVGAAFGLGFILGPVIGGVLGHIGVSISEAPPFGHGFPALGAALLAFANFLLAIRILKESLPEDRRRRDFTMEPRLSKITQYFKKPVVGPLLWVSFFSIFAFAQMESVLFLLVEKRFGWSMSTASFAFAYVGLVSAFTQGYLVRKLLPRWGERPIMFYGLLLSALGLLFLGFCPDPYSMAVVITILSVGVGLRNPSLLGSISVKSSASEQGSVMGVNQSLASLGRILGPPLGGLIYAYSVPAPFVVAGLITFVGFFIVWKIYDEIPEQSLSKSKGGQESQPGASNYNLIAEYQFKNLLGQRIPFLLLDLRGSPISPSFPEAVSSSMTTLLTDVASRTQDHSFPIVIICETGETSRQAAVELTKNSYMNVVVLEGGTRSLGT